MELEYKKLFVIGCPRSGTTWVQLLLAQHSEIATAPETQIFAYYLEHFIRQWRHEHEGPGREYQGRAGLSRLLSEEEFVDLCRLNASFVLDRIRARRPEASLVVEKSPKHALQAEFIHRVFPDAYFLHVIRDPRDTAASLLAAGRAWGRGWAPKSAISAARMWADHIESARRIADRTDRYREIQYEALRADPASELEGMLAWLGVPGEGAFCEEAVSACEIGRLQKGAGNENLPVPGEKSPIGFFRKGAVGGWHDELSRSAIAAIEHITASYLHELGYEPVSATRRPMRVSVHDAIQRVRESIDWQLQRLLHRV